jgi:hypothetical protein
VTSVRGRPTVGVAVVSTGCVMSSSSGDPTPLFLAQTLPYPITVLRLLVPPSSGKNTKLRHLRQTSSSIARTTPLFTYEYAATLNTGPDASDLKGKSKEERIVEVYESPIEGDLVEWLVNEGQRIGDMRCDFHRGSTLMVPGSVRIHFQARQ